MTLSWCTTNFSKSCPNFKATLYEWDDVLNLGLKRLGSNSSSLLKHFHKSWRSNYSGTYINTVISWGCYVCDSSASPGVKCKSVFQQSIFMYNTKYISSSHVVSDLNIQCKQKQDSVMGAEIGQRMRLIGLICVRSTRCVVIHWSLSFFCCNRRSGSMIENMLAPNLASLKIQG